MVNNFSVNYQASPSGLTSHISVSPLGFYLTPENWLNFLPDLYVPSWLGKFFKFMVFKLLENAFASQKIESWHFHSCFSRQNITLPGRGKLHIPQKAALFGKFVLPSSKGTGRKLWHSDVLMSEAFLKS